MSDQAKKKAGYAAVDQFVKNNQVIGIGSGSTIPFAVERLKQRVEKEGLSVICVPTSFQATQLILDNGLKLSDLTQNPELDVAIDGADEVDKDLNLIKGGGGCQLQEKIVASAAKQLVIIADYKKDSQQLGEKWKKGVPLEVIPMALGPVKKKIEKLGGKPVLRMAEKKAGPVISDNGNFIIDADFGVITDPEQLNNNLLQIPGVVETGLFIKMAKKVFFGQENGDVVERE